MKNLNKYLNILKSSENEEEVLTILKKIVKTFNVDKYKSEIISNPYFYSLLPDIKNEVLLEMLEISKSIKEEISIIDNEIISSINKNDFIKLKKLKNECIYLLNELENRKSELENLF